MEIEIAKDRLLRKLSDYANARKRDVDKGLETAKLAGVFVQKYGYGLCDGFNEIFEGQVGLTYSDVDRAVASIDPDWKETQASR